LGVQIYIIFPFVKTSPKKVLYNTVTFCYINGCKPDYSEFYSDSKSSNEIKSVLSYLI